MCVCVHASVHACVSACVRACVCVCNHSRPKLLDRCRNLETRPFIADRLHVEHEAGVVKCAVTWVLREFRASRAAVAPGKAVDWGKLTFDCNSKLRTVHEEACHAICQTAYFELKRISSIRSFSLKDAAKTLVTSYILSRLDYCNCLLMGTPNSVL